MTAPAVTRISRGRRLSRLAALRSAVRFALLLGTLPMLTGCATLITQGVSVPLSTPDAMSASDPSPRPRVRTYDGPFSGLAFALGSLDDIGTAYVVDATGERLEPAGHPTVGNYLFAVPARLVDLPLSLIADIVVLPWATARLFRDDGPQPRPAVVADAVERAAFRRRVERSLLTARLSRRVHRRADGEPDDLLQEHALVDLTGDGVVDLVTRCDDELLLWPTVPADGGSGLATGPSEVLARGIRDLSFLPAAADGPDVILWHAPDATTPNARALSRVRMTELVAGRDAESASTIWSRRPDDWRLLGSMRAILPPAGFPWFGPELARSESLLMMLTPVGNARIFDIETGTCIDSAGRSVADASGLRDIRAESPVVGFADGFLVFGRAERRRVRLDGRGGHGGVHTIEFRPDGSTRVVSRPDDIDRPVVAATPWPRARASAAAPAGPYLVVRTDAGDEHRLLVFPDWFDRTVPPFRLSIPANADTLGAADVDGDGAADLVYAAAAQGRARRWCAHRFDPDTGFEPRPRTLTSDELVVLERFGELAPVVYPLPRRATVRAGGTSGAGVAAR